MTVRTPPAPLLLALLLAAPCSRAQLAVAGTDNQLVLVDGTDRVVPDHAPDTFVVVDLSGPAPRKLAEIPGVPTSVVGPPLSVAQSPDETLALDTCSMKVDPSDPTKQVFDDRMSVIDLTDRSAPVVIATLHTGLGPAGVSINRQGTLALVADRGDGTVSIFTIAGHTVTPAGSISVGNAASALAHVAFTPDGRHAFVTRDGDNVITELAIDGSRVTLAGRDVHAGLRPYGFDVSPDGRIAVVANDGMGGGDADTVSLIDLAHGPAHTVDTRTVGQTPEGIKLSPDGTLCGVVVENGSTKRPGGPFYAPHGEFVLFRVKASKLKLKRLAEAPIGTWSQGVAFSNDNRTIVVCNMVEKDLQVFSWDGKRLRDTGHPIALGGGPVAIRVADR